jgi:hypothetical protein
LSVALIVLLTIVTVVTISGDVLRVYQLAKGVERDRRPTYCLSVKLSDGRGFVIEDYRGVKDWELLRSGLEKLNDSTPYPVKIAGNSPVLVGFALGLCVISGLLVVLPGALEIVGQGLSRAGAWIVIVAAVFGPVGLIIGRANNNRKH